ncbi:hypothetical protein Mapa_008596 [Marchantia paleacea]|nr:hypothetical protein Mapa_008596 [Marchantia paleacea]
MKFRIIEEGRQSDDSALNISRDQTATATAQTLKEKTRLTSWSLVRHIVRLQPASLRQLRDRIQVDVLEWVRDVRLGGDQIANASRTDSLDCRAAFRSRLLGILAYGRHARQQARENLPARIRSTRCARVVSPVHSCYGHEHEHQSRRDSAHSCHVSRHDLPTIRRLSPPDGIERKKLRHKICAKRWAGVTHPLTHSLALSSSSQYCLRAAALLLLLGSGRFDIICFCRSNRTTQQRERSE